MFALVRVVPRGGVAISVMLGAFVVMAGAALAYLLLFERLKQGGVFACKEQKNAAEGVFEACEGAESRDVEADGAEVGESEAEVPEMMPAAVTVRQVSESAPLPSVSVHQANEMMSDREAREALCTRPSDAEGARGGRKYEVNIDTISALFAPEETVSLQSLKDKGILPDKARFVKILARGSLDKPLTVIAQDFSTAAVKMITLTGGKAVIVE